MANNVALGNRIQTTTLQKYAPKLVDTVLNSNMFFSRTVRAAEQWAGRSMVFPVKIAKNLNGGSFSGFQTLSTAATNNFINLEYYPSFEQIPVALPLDELSVNDVDSTQALNLVAYTVKSAAEDMADNLGTEFYGDGTGNSNNNFLGLGVIVSDTLSIGGQSRTTYPTLASTVTASGGALTLLKMATLYNAASNGGSVNPTVSYITKPIRNFYEALLQPQERLNKTGMTAGSMNQYGMKKGQGLTNGTGYLGFDFRGMPVLTDQKCTAGYMYMLNEDFIEFHGLPMAPLGQTSTAIDTSAVIEGNDYSDVPGLGFSWSGWVSSIDQAAYVGRFFFGGQLITTDPVRQAVLTGITS